MKALSTDEENFCKMYAKCFDGAKAYSLAFGCDYKESAQKADALMRKENIREKIRELKTARFNRELIDADDIIGMYIKIAFADLNDYLDFGKKTVVDENGEEKTENEVNFRKESTQVDTTAISSVTSSKTGWKITFYDRMKALEWLGKHLGLDSDKAEQQEGGIVIVPDVEEFKKESE